MPNLDRCPVRQRDLYLAVRHLFRSPRRRHLDRPRALAVCNFPDRLYWKEYRRRFRPENAAAYLELAQRSGVALATLDIPAYPPDALPPELAALPAVKPGSRALTGAA